MIRGKLPRISAAEAREYAMRLNHDPFLVGLFTLMADEGMDDAIGQFLEMQLRDICSTALSIRSLPNCSTFWPAWRFEMILRRNLQPSLGELESWFGDQSKAMRGMRLLVRHGASAGWTPTSDWGFVTTASKSGFWCTRWPTYFSCRNHPRTSSPIPISQ